MAIKWGRDLKAESHLRRLGIEFSVETVRLAEIDTELSMERQARIGKKINDDWVLEFGQAMLDGAEFPMCILQKIKGGRYFIWSGNHRTNAAKLIGELEYPAYIVKVTDLRMQDILPRVVNTWEGHRESREAVLEHAKYAVERHGIEPEEAARMFGLKIDWLWLALRAGKIEKQLNDAGVKTAGFAKSIILKLGTIGNANAMKAAAKLIKDEGLAGARADQIVDDVRKHSTEAQQIAEVSRWRKLFDERKPTNTVPIRRKNRSRIVDMLTRLEKFLSGIKKASQLQLDDTDVKIVASAWNQVERKMNALMTEGNP